MRLCIISSEVMIPQFLLRSSRVFARMIGLPGSGVGGFMLFGSPMVEWNEFGLKALSSRLGRPGDFAPSSLTFVLTLGPVGWENSMGRPCAEEPATPAIPRQNTRTSRAAPRRIILKLKLIFGYNRNAKHSCGQNQSGSPSESPPTSLQMPRLAAATKSSTVFAAAPENPFCAFPN